MVWAFGLSNFEQGCGGKPRCLVGPARQQPTQKAARLAQPPMAKTACQQGEMQAKHSMKRRHISIMYVSEEAGRWHDHGQNLCHMCTHANSANACSSSKGTNMAMTKSHVHAYTHTRAGLPHQAWTISGQKRDPAVSHHEAVSVTVISWHVGSGAVCLQLFAGCVALWL